MKEENTTKEKFCTRRDFIKKTGKIVLATSSFLIMKSSLSNAKTVRSYYSDGYYSDGYYSDGYYSDGYYSDGYYSDGYYSDNIEQSSLTSFTFIDIAIDSNDTIYAVALKKSVSSNSWVRADGYVYYEHDLYMLKIDSCGNVNESKIDTFFADIANCGTFIIQNNTIKVFFIHSDKYQYAMTGNTYTLNKSDLVKTDISTLFTGANWGWYPVFKPNGDIQHFSFDGYYRMLNTTQIERVSPETMSNEYATYQSNRSQNIMPDTNQNIITKITNKISSNTCNIILNNSSSNITITSGITTKVYGTSGSNHIIIESGANVKLINFPGSNEVKIQEDSTLFNVFRSGATVTFKDSNGTVLTIPATKAPQSIIFNDRTLTLVINNNQVKLGNQVVNLTPSPIL
jgi:hypothetical protein